MERFIAEAVADAWRVYDRRDGRLVETYQIGRYTAGEAKQYAQDLAEYCNVINGVPAATR